MESINKFDLIVVTLITLLGLKGLFRGFIKEFFAIIGIIGGVFIASRVAGDVGILINNLIPIENQNSIMLAGFIFSLIIFWIIAYFIGAILSKLFTLSGLSFLDRILGFIFGASKVFLLFAIISFAVSNVKVINENLKPRLKNSVVFPILVNVGSILIKLDTTTLQKKVLNSVDEVVNSTQDGIKTIIKDEILEKVNK